MSTSGPVEENRRLIEGLYSAFSRWEIPTVQSDQQSEDEF